MDWGIIYKNRLLLLEGLKVTLYVSSVSIGIGTIISIILGIVYVSGNKFVKKLISFYVFIMRSLPFLLVVFCIFFILPFMKINFSALTSGIISLTLYFIATGTEIVRGSIESVSKHQGETAYALGMDYKKSMLWVIFPQALLSMMPPMINEFVFLLKSSSIVSIAGVPDLMGIGREIIEREYRGFEIICAIGAIYYILCIVLSYLGRKIEGKLAYRMGR